jgi:hypothetical protein
MNGIAALIRDAIKGDVKQETLALRKELGLSFCP